MITIATRPQAYSPLNAAIWKITSDQANLQGLKVIIKEAVSGLVLFTKRYATLPMLPNGSVFDIAPELSSFLDVQIVTGDVLLQPVTKSMIGYTLTITELYRDLTTGAIVEGGTYDAPGASYVFNANLSRQDFAVYDYKKFVTGGYYEATRFLSRRPATSSLYYSSLEYLYFISSIAARIEIDFYKRGTATPISTQFIDIPGSTSMYRLNISPKTLEAFYGDDILNNYGSEFDEVFDLPFGTIYGILDANYFTVKIVDVGGNPLTEIRTYMLQSDDCRKTVLELLFGNNLGGVDSMIFVEPKESINSAKASIDTNPLQFNSTADLVGIDSGVFNPDTVIISSVNVSTFSLISEPLSDASALYGKALIESDRVYMKLSTGNLYPVKLETIDYQVLKRKYTTDNKRMSITFKVTDTNFTL